MSEIYWLTEAQVERLKPFFAKSRGKPKVKAPRKESVATEGNSCNVKRINTWGRTPDGSPQLHTRSCRRA